MSWDRPRDLKLQELREQGYSFEAIAEFMTRWFEGERYTKDSVQKRYQLIALPPSIPSSSEPMPTYHRYFTEQGRPLSVREKVILPPVVNQAHMEILHISDLHIDQHDEELINHVLRRHCGADVVVVAGDALDVYAYSRFEKTQHRPIEWEIEAWMRLQEHLAQNFPQVIIIDSNHLQRVPRSFNIPAGLGFLANHNLMDHLAQPFENVFVVDDWWVQLGSALFTHADYATSLAPKAGIKVHEFMSQRLATRQFPLRPYNVLVQAHTHAVGATVVGTTKILESGCLAKLPLEYTSASTAVKYPKAQVNGYVTVVLDHGVADLNECREHYLGDLSGSRVA